MGKAPAFQHRHYKTIAAWVDTTRDHLTVREREYLAHSLAELFARDNPRFDRCRFIDAASGKPSNGRDKVRS